MSDNKKARRPSIETLEPRILFSADPLAIAIDTAVDEAYNDSQNQLDAEAELRAEYEQLLLEKSEKDKTFELLQAPANDDNNDQIANELVVIDTSVPEYELFLEDILAQQNEGRLIDVVTFDGSEDGVAAITNAIGEYDSLEALHIISHGGDGALQLGSNQLSLETVDGLRDQLVGWSNAFSEEGDILIYGCDLAASESGGALVNIIGDLTETDVAASDDLTGHSSLGADWDFEYHHGAIQTDIAFSESLQGSWIYSLDITSNLVGHWDFEEGSGTTATDQAGNQNGTIYNSPSWNGSGAVGSDSLDFSSDVGGNSYVEIADNAAQDVMNGDYTVSFWYNQSGNPSGDIHFAGSTVGFGSAGIEIYGDSFGWMNIRVGDGGSMSGTGFSASFDGAWHMVSVAWDDSAGELRMYHDGAYQSSLFSGVGNMNTTNAFTIGAQSGGSVESDSSIDDVRIYGRELSDSDVTELYNEAVPTNQSPTIAVNTGISVDEDDSVTITSSHLNEGDPDDDGAGLTYTVTAGLSNGQLELTTGPGVSITSFTQDDIDNNRLIYVHDGSETTSDSFDFDLADGGEDGATPASGAFSITINEVNDAPVDLSSGIEINSDGGNDVYLQADNGGAIVGGLGQITVETSFSFSSAPSGSIALLSYAEGTNDEALGLFITNSGQLLFTADSSGTAQASSAIYTELFDGNKHHLAASWDNSDGAVHFYVDGVLAESFSGYQATQTIGAGGVLVIGNDQDTVGGGFDPNQAFSGTFYDIRIWDDVRTDAEISLHYQHKFDNGNIPNDLIANWQMDGFNGSNEVVDVVSANNLSVGHASGGGFSTSTPVGDLHIQENSSNGARVGFVVPSEVDEVPSGSYTFTLLDDAGGRFAINSSTGEVTVADGLLLNYENSTSHNITVEVKDGDDKTYSEVMTIVVDDDIDGVADSYNVSEDGTLNVAAPGVLTNDAVGPAGLAGNTVVGFDATTDTDGNGTWSSNIGSVDLTAGTGVSYTTSPDNAPAGITAAFDSTGSGGLTTSALDGFPEIDGTQSATLETWVHVDSIGGTQVLFDTGDTGGTGITLMVNGGWLDLHVADAGSLSSDGVSSPLSSSTWHHIALTVDMSGGTPEVTVYIDGTQELQVVRSLPNWAPGDFGLGTVNGTTVGGYNGSISGQFAHFRVHDEVLSSTDINDHASNPGAIGSSPFVAAYDDGATLGNVTVNADGSFNYDPNGQFDYLASGASANDTFTYTYDDGLGNQEEITVTITVDGVNDAPTILTNTGVTVNEGSSVTITSTDLSGADVDDADATLVYSITDFATSGRLELSTNPGVEITSFTQDDIDNNRLVYINGGSETTSDSFDFSVADGGEDGAAPATGTFSITINQVNDAPQFGVHTGFEYSNIGGTQSPQAIAIQPDGKTLVAGFNDTGTDKFEVTRFNADGTIDTSFGTNGVVSTAMGFGSRAYEMTLLDDGSFILSGNGNGDAQVVKYLSDGSLDNTFGSSGIASVDILGQTTTAWDHYVADDGSIFLSGYVNDGSDTDFAVIKLTSTGAIDTSFAGTGYAVHDTATDDVGWGITVQDDGKVVIVGRFAGVGWDIGLIRYNTDGTPDTSFGTNGVVDHDATSNTDSITEVVVQPDGKILVAGSGTSGAQEPMLVRYNSDGSVDTGFGVNGVVHGLTGTLSVGESIVLLDDGSILMTGTVYNATTDIFVAKYTSTGALDTSFGGGSGYVVVDGNGTADSGKDIAVANDGSITIAARSNLDGDFDYTVLKLDSSGEIDNQFGLLSNQLDGNPTFIEGGSAVTLDSDINIFDAELSSIDDFSGASLNIQRSGGADTDDVFSLLGSPAFNGSFSSVNGLLTINFTAGATNAEVNSILQAIQYSNSSDAPPVSVDLVWTFNDGNSGSQGSGGALEAVGSTTVNMTAVNDAPLITSGPGGGTHNEGTSGTYFNSSLTITDADSANFDGGQMTVTVTNNGEAGDRLLVRDGNSVSVSGSNISYDFGGGPVVVGTFSGGDGTNPLVITFNSSADAVAVESVGQQVAYRTDIDNPSTLQRTLTMQVTDGDSGTSNTATRVMNVIAHNDVATFGGDSTGSVTEDVDPDTDTLLETSGALTISDPDGAGEESFQAETINGTYGDLTIDTAGNWTYEADNTQAAIQSLDVGESINDVITVTAFDGTTTTVTITINGAEDAPVLGGDTTGVVTEDGTLTDNGTLTITDVDTSDNPVTWNDETATLGDNGYGNFEITNGTWTYTVNNSHASAQALGVGETLTDTYTFTASDGSTQLVTVTINGAEDASVVGGDTTGAVNEDGTLTDNGTLTITDVDTSDNPVTWNDETATLGDNGYGTFAITNGTWTYTVNNSHASVQALDLGESLTDTYTFTASDGSTQTVTVTINGAEDASVVGGDTSGAVTEDGTLTDNGTLTITDVDTSDNPVTWNDETATLGDNGFGNFEITNGTWMYTVNNSHASVQALDVGESLTDTYTFTASDGSTQLVTVTINGMEDASVVGGDTSGAVTEDGTLTDNGTLTISDVDTSDNPVAWNDESPILGDNGYGNFEITSGTWIYTLNNSHASVQALDVGETLTDTYTFTASDGSTQLVTVTINGAEDASVLGGDTSGTVAEDGTLTDNGTLTITDVDTSDNPVTWNNESASLGDNGYGDFEITNGTWTYTVNNSHASVQALDVGESLTDTYTFTASDGSTQLVTITINGSEDASVLGGDTSGIVAEDGTLTDNGTLTITDVDTNDNPVTWNDESATAGDNGYGNFEITNGTWTYILNNSHASVQALDVGESLTDTYTFTASDGSTQLVTVTINGAEDAPVDLSSGIEINSDGGNDAYFQADDGNAILAGLDALTVELTFSSTDSVGEHGLVEFTDGTENLMVRVQNNGNLIIRINGDAEFFSGINYQDTLFGGDIHSLAITWDNTAGDLKVFVDGVETDSATGVRAGQTINSSGNPLVIGSGYNTSGVFGGGSKVTDATFYDVRFWDVARTTAEIDATDKQKFSTSDLPDNLIANWQMDGFNGSNEVVDVVAGNNLSVGHASGAGYTASTAMVDLHVEENASNGTRVGYVIPSDIDQSLPGTFTFDLLNNAGGRFAIDNVTGEVTVNNGSLLNYESATSHNITVEVTDSTGETYNEVIAIVIDDVNEAPTVDNPIADQIATEDSAFNFSFAANTFGDVDAGTSLTYSAQLSGGGSLPGWLSFDSGTRTFSGTPLNDDVGTISVEVIADDGSLTVSDVFDITVNNTNDTPTFGGDNTGFVTEDVDPDVDTLLETAGTLTISDPDVGESSFQAEIVNGTYGDLTIDTAGNWTYEADNTQAVIQNLDVGESINDVITVTAFDGTTTTVTITINGTEDSPALGGDTSGTVNEDGTLTDNGTLTISDVDTSDNPVTWNNESATLGDNGYGDFEIANGTWTYILNNSHASVQALDVGETLTDTYTFTASDGSTQLVTVTINGAEDASVLGGDTTGTVAEDGTLTDNGTLTISDVDTNDNPVTWNDETASLGDNGYGDFEITNGTWTYTLNNSHANVQALDTGETLTDTYTFTASDGSTQLVTVTINGAEDAPTIDNLIPDQTAAEDSAFNFTFAVNAFGDVDTSDILTYSAQLSGGGSLPSWLSFDAGTRTFSGTPLNADVGTISVEVIADDGTSTVSDVFDLTVNNTNDTPTFGGDNTGSVTEDVDPDVDTLLETAGTLTVSDPDVGESSFQAETVNGTYGDLTIDTAGNWTYQADNMQSAIQNLDVGESINDVITVTAFDGTTTTVTITINGAEDASVVGGDTTGVVAEDGTLTDNGTLTISDVDTSDNPVTWNNESATLGDNGYGDFEITSGTWTYTLNNSHAGVQALDAGETLTDTYTFTASDGSTQLVTVTINGAEDAPTLDNLIPDQNATEDSPFNFTFAVNAFGDVDTSDTLTYSAQLSGGGSLPAWLSFDAGTRTFSGTPLNADVGTISVEVIADDGSSTISDVFDLTVNNTNDTPIFGGDITGSVAEDVDPDIDTLLETAGTLTISDPDVGESSFQAETVNGTYGDLTIDTAGNWTYEADNTQNAIQSLDVGESINDVITVTAFDGTTTTVTITINGAEDASVFGGDTLGTVIEDGTLTDNGTLTISDVDTSDNPVTWNNESATLGDNGYGDFEITSGTWTYTLNNNHASVQALDSGGSLIDTFTFAASDGSTQLVSITINGAEDAPTVENLIPNQIATEDSAFNFTFAANAFGDVDTSDSLTYSAQLSGGGSLPSWLSFDAGTRTFTGTPLNADVGTISVEVIADDGTSTASDVFDLTVNNTNDTPTLGGDNTGSVTEDVDPDVDTLLETAGTLTISDPDVGESTFQAEIVNGTYGDLTIDTAGNWTYEADNMQSAIQNLDVGESINDVITVTAFDGTTTTVTITINGAEDASVVGGDTTGVVAEDGTLTDNGTLTISDVDTSDNPVTWNDGSATTGDNGYGSFQITNGVWTYAVNNDHPEVQQLNAGESLNDTYTFVASDGSTQQVSVVISGADEPVIILDGLDSLSSNSQEQGESTFEESGAEEEEDLSGSDEGELREPQTPVLTADDFQINNSNIPTDVLVPTVSSSEVEDSISLFLGKDKSQQSEKDELLYLLNLRVPKLNGVFDQWFEASSIARSETLYIELDQLNRQLSDITDRADAEHDLKAQAMLGMAASFSAGFVSWIFKAGSLLSSMASVLPVWRHLDPLPLLTGKSDEEEEQLSDDNSDSRESDQVEKMFNQNKDV